MVDPGWKRYFVPLRRVDLDNVTRVADLARYELFALPQRRTGLKPMFSSLGTLNEVTPFDERGRRRISVTTAAGIKPIFQGVTEIGPNYLKVIGLSHSWEHGLSTKSIPIPKLDAMIRTAIDQNNPDDRMSVARFYLQVGYYLQAAHELESMMRDFPELKSTIDEISRELRQLQGNQLLNELRRRRDTGQHALAYETAMRFPEDRINASILNEARELISEYDQAHEQAEHALLLLGELQAALSDEEQLAGVVPLRSAVKSRLNYESLNRLSAFLNLAADESLSAEEKLSVAYSGWVLGSANAITDLNTTLRLWEARFLILEFLRSDNPQQRDGLIEQLEKIEGVGPERIGQLIPHLPPAIETPEIEPGVAGMIDMVGSDPKERAKYAVLLPNEYTPHRQYPTIVALRPAERSIERMLDWWGGAGEKQGLSRRRGYIVIAPDYLAPKTSEYGYDEEAHAAVTRCIRDARKRFSVDSDRIFLSGHGVGGDAAFDIGMSHPDLFAGVIPIAGIGRNYCTYYWENAKQLPFFIVGGELDRDSLRKNANGGQVNRMMRHGFDVIYVDYIGRGYENYYEEIQTLFDWMDRHQRVKYLKEVKMKVLRPGDNRFFWIEEDQFPPSMLGAVPLAGDHRGHVKPMLLHAKVTFTNALYIVRSRAAKHTLWLSPEFVDFEKRVVVRVGTRQKFNKFVGRSVQTMLEDLRVRGDRQKLYWAKLVID
jgi:predicted esterase